MKTNLYYKNTTLRIPMDTWNAVSATLSKNGCRKTWRFSLKNRNEEIDFSFRRRGHIAMKLSHWLGRKQKLTSPLKIFRKQAQTFSLREKGTKFLEIFQKETFLLRTFLWTSRMQKQRLPQNVLSVIYMQSWHFRWSSIDKQLKFFFISENGKNSSFFENKGFFSSKCIECIKCNFNQNFPKKKFPKKKHFP